MQVFAGLLLACFVGVEIGEGGICLLTGAMDIDVILFVGLPSGVGCSDPVEPECLADAQVVVQPEADPGLFDFLMRLLEELEKVCFGLPEAWPQSVPHPRVPIKSADGSLVLSADLQSSGKPSPAAKIFGRNEAVVNVRLLRLERLEIARNATPVKAPLTARRPRAAWTAAASRAEELIWRRRRRKAVQKEHYRLTETAASWKPDLSRRYPAIFLNVFEVF